MAAERITDRASLPDHASRERVSRQSPALSSSGHAEDRHVVGHAVDDGGTHGHRAPATDADVVTDARRPGRPWCRRRSEAPPPTIAPGAIWAERADTDVVLDDRPGVDDRVRPDRPHRCSRSAPASTTPPGASSAAVGDPGRTMDARVAQRTSCAHRRRPRAASPPPRRRTRARATAVVGRRRRELSGRSASVAEHPEAGGLGRVLAGGRRAQEPPLGQAVVRGIGDDPCMLAAAEDDRVGRAAHSVMRDGIGACAAGRGGRHASMICATRSPARPSGRCPEPGGRLARSRRRGLVAARSATATGSAGTSTTLPVRRATGLAIADVDDRQTGRGRLDQPARAVAEHGVGDAHEQAPVAPLAERGDERPVAGGRPAARMSVRDLGTARGPRWAT